MFAFSHPPPLLLLVLASLILYFNRIVGTEVRISNTNDFSTFVNNVNNGANYSGTTVFLDSDLSLSEVTEPIGSNSTHYFNGTFNGQGYIISNLNINSSSSIYTGLFGYSHGLTIRNVVLDSSCSITGYNDYLGGLIGNCYPTHGDCLIENNVNMASIIFNGNIKGKLNLGGIVGSLYSTYSHNTYIKNCVNYGDITHSGTSILSCMGGLIGDSSVNNYKYIQNCLNYGTITYNGTTTNVAYLGGIVGNSFYTYVENCVSGGKIVLSGDYQKTNIFIGSIVGSGSSIYINYCYYSNELSEYNVYGSIKPTNILNTCKYNSVTFELNEDVSAGNYTGNSLINVLNAYADHYTLREYSHWVLNKVNKSVSFSINDRGNLIKMDYQIILLPSLANEGIMSFDGWYVDNECVSLFTAYEVARDTDLYGKYETNTNYYTITFDTKREGLYIGSISKQFHSNISLPNNLISEDCTIAYWETGYGDKIGFNLVMPAHNITIYAVWKCIHIKTLDDFLNFAKIVNSRTDYFSGTTVFLDSDLSLLGEQVEPIGKNNFLGTFDGQGHVISDLKIQSFSSEHAGLFGYSSGLTIRNVVLDGSCSITSLYNGSYIYVGGFLGYCYANDGDCVIENIVNMASATFDGVSSSGYLYLGGIIGCISSYYSSYKAYVRNCVNYGSITQSGNISYSTIGGIVGRIANLKHVFIQNCLNYGLITHNVIKTDYLYMGGIIGYTEYTTIENCVSAGKIVSKYIATYSHTGSIVGIASNYTTIDHCYFTESTTINDLCGYEYSPPNVSNTLTSSTNINSTLANNLNDQSSFNKWNKWLLITGNNAHVGFKINNNSVFHLSSHLILLPDLASDWRSFVGWFTDSDFTTPFDLRSYISANKMLYGRWDKYLVIFDPNGEDESVVPMNMSYSETYDELLTVKRTGYTFIGWFTERIEGTLVDSSTKMPVYDHTLYARWVINKYTITFNFDNETTETRTFEFNSSVIYPEDPVKEGYMFNGWNKNDVEFMPAENITITALWEKITAQVEIVFDTKGLTDEKIEEIVKQYIDTEFTVIKVYDGETGETMVIIEFVSIEKAEEFVRNVKASGRATENMIKRVEFNSERFYPSSLLLCSPLLYFGTLIL